MKKRKYCRLAKFIFSILFVLIITGGSFTVNAENKDTYFYSFSTGEPVATVSPTVYQMQKKITLGSLCQVGTVEDFCRDKEGNWYFVDSGLNQVILLDDNFNFVKSFSDFGDFGVLNQPSDICLFNENLICIADAGNKRLLFCDNQGNAIKAFDMAETEELRSDFVPSKVSCGNEGQIYVISKNDYSGIIELDENGTFLGYIGAANVTFSFRDYIWKKVMSETQKDKQVQFIPVEYVNLSVDEQGFIYAVASSDTETAPVKRLNPAGTDVLSRNGYTSEVCGDLTTNSALIDISSNQNGLYHVLDSRFGRIFTYDSDGYLLYVFGGLGTSEGKAVQPVAITSDNNCIYELDKGTNSILCFETTEYAKAIAEGIEQYNSGYYEESLDTWKKVLRMNSNYEIAYAQIGKSLLRMDKYEDAMYYFELGNFRGDRIVMQSGYNKAFSLYRDDILTNYWWLFILVIIVIVFVWKFVHKQYQKSQNKVIISIRNSFFVRQCTFSKHLIYHPFKGFWEMKREKEGSLLFSLFLILIWIISNIFETQATGFLFTSSTVVMPDIMGVIRNCLLILILIVVGNWCITTLMGGEGTMKDIVMTFGYATIPMTLIKFPLCIATNFLTYSEWGYVSIIEIFAIGWFVFLLFFGLQTIHQYSTKKNIATILLTCFAAVVIIFVSMVFFNLIVRVVAFISAVYKEIMLR